MAFSVTFPNLGPCPDIECVTQWLTERSEPFEQESSDSLRLLALPVRLLCSRLEHMQGQIDVTSDAPLVRLVDLLFYLSVQAGSDVHLTGDANETTSRAELWLRLADEQDRLRIAKAVDAAQEHGNREELVNRLWAAISAMWPGGDVRWDISLNRIVEIKEVDEPGGITVEEAQWHAQGALPGDVVAVPLSGYLHILAWRWLSEAYPGLTEQ